MNYSLRARRVLACAASLILALTISVFFLPASPAHASSVTRYVGAAAGSNTGCGSPGFISIQAAVDAAVTGDTVYLCGTTPYTQSVIIHKSLTLTGDSGATIAAPVTFPAAATVLPKLPTKFTTDNLFVPEALVFVWGTGITVNLNGITLTGAMPTNNGCANDEYGVLVLDSAAVALDHMTVKNIYDSNSSLYGCQFGVGIQAGRTYWHKADFSGPLVENFVGHLTMTNSTVSGSQKNDVTIDGPGSSGDIATSTIKGAGRDAHFAPALAQNGIQFSRGAIGQVHDSAISDHSYTGAAQASSAGIIVFGGCGDGLVNGVKIFNNVLTNNDVGVDVENYTADPNCTTAPATQTNVVVCNNSIQNDQVSNVGATTLGGKNYQGYQAGIIDVGNHDSLVFNLIAGVGYAEHNTAGGPFVTAIDTTSYAASISPNILTSPLGLPLATPGTAAQNAFVRVVESSSIYGSMDVVLDKSPIFLNVAKCTASSYIPVIGGAHILNAFAPSGSPSVAIMPVTLTAGKYYTIALIANPPSLAPAMVVFEDDLSINPNQAKVRVYHLSDSSGPISVTSGTTTVVPALAFASASSYLTENVGATSFTLKELNLPNTMANTTLALAANNVYSIFWMCGTQIVPAATTGVPTSLPNTGQLLPIANYTWWIVSILLLALIGAAAGTRFIIVRRSSKAAV